MTNSCKKTVDSTVSLLKYWELKYWECQAKCSIHEETEHLNTWCREGTVCVCKNLWNVKW